MTSLTTTPMVGFANPVIGEDEIEAVVRVMRSGVIAQGPEVAAFEREFAERMGAAHAVAVNSGTAALEVALAALDIGPGDEVIVPAFTFIATAATVARTGATVRFADVRPDTFCLDPATLPALLNDRTRLVVPVALYGMPADVPGIRAVVPADIAILEDAAQAHGAARAGRPVGADEIATFSFYPTKNMTTAEGGMVTCGDERIAEQLRLVRNHGMAGPYEYLRLGGNLRMTDLGAAIGRVQLGRLDGFLDRRRAIADRYRAELADLAGWRLPTPAAGGDHAWSVFTVVHDDRDALAAHLGEQGVMSKVYYPEPLNRLDLFENDDTTPVSDELAATVLSLPIRPDLDDADVARVIDACRSF